MFASNLSGGLIAVLIGGTLVPFPDTQSLDGFIVNATSDIFTVPATGRYYISYRINLTTPLLVSTRILSNGVPVPASVISPLSGVTSFNTEVITALTGGDTISIQMFGVAAIAVLAATIPTDLVLIRVS
uniref:BclA C-terminal domain-containing protein n=1 Tax=Bacillus tropicus TaxID=2026188 RepID=UPI00398323C8